MWNCLIWIRKLQYFYCAVQEREACAHKCICILPASSPTVCCGMTSGLCILYLVTFPSSVMPLHTTCLVLFLANHVNSCIRRDCLGVKGWQGAAAKLIHIPCSLLLAFVSSTFRKWWSGQLYPVTLLVNNLPATVLLRLLQINLVFYVTSILLCLLRVVELHSVYIHVHHPCDFPLYSGFPLSVL